MHDWERIKNLRKNKGLTQKELGDRVNKSAQVISNWERAYTPTINYDALARLADILGTTGDYILGRDSLNKLTVLEKKAAWSS